MRWQMAIITALLILSSSALAAQGRGSGMGQGRQPGAAGPAASGMQNKTQQQNQAREQQRLRSQATEQQRQQYASCTGTMQRLRTRLREMSRLARGQTIGADQAAQWREQLRNELQTMQQEQEQLRTSLSDEQKTAATPQLDQIKQRSAELEAWSDVLELELERENPNAAKVAEQAQKVDAGAKKLQKQQRELASHTGIS